MPRDSYLLFLLLAIQSSFTQRRIKSGLEVSDKRYMVYLIPAPSDPQRYRGWMCGGAIVSKDFVITSAACVQDVKHMYVISGYKNYVTADQMEEDKCISKMKKKVIQTCVPMDYMLDYNKSEIWGKIDIAVIKVDTPFDFTDKTYETLCSYIPDKIKYNTEKDFPKPGDDVIALGWGHTKGFRKETEFRDLNSKTLLYAPTKVLDSKICGEQYKENPSIVNIIMKTMICTLGKGNLNDRGGLIERSRPIGGCLSKQAILRGAVGRMCEYEELREDLIPEGMEYPMDDEQYQEMIANGDARRIDYKAEYDNMNVHYSDLRKHGNNTRQILNNTRKTFNGNHTIKNSNSTKNLRNHRRKLKNYTRKYNNSNNTQNTYNNKSYNNNNTRRQVNEEEMFYGAQFRRDDEVTTEAVEKTTVTGATVVTKAVSMKPKPVDTPSPSPGSVLNSEDLRDTPGICQNDHGGPLVAWRGPDEVLLAVATMFKVDNHYECTGPFLFTKTSCNYQFLECIIEQMTPNDDKTRRQNACDDPAEMGFEIVRRHISWVGHRDGPAANEHVGMRKQVPMSAFQPGRKQVNSRLQHKKNNNN